VDPVPDPLLLRKRFQATSVENKEEYNYNLEQA
jgi:hypothetical protein